MKRRLFFGNFDFEHQLADPNWHPKLALTQLNAELAVAWLAIADDGDLVWTPSPINDNFLTHANLCGLPKIIPVTAYSAVPGDVEFIPWGWTLGIRRLVDRFGWTANAPTDQAVRLANSRSTSFELEQRSGTSLQTSCRIESIEKLKAAIGGISESQGWIVKAEFGMSARERLLGRGFARPEHENWVRRRLQNGRAVFFEPWVERISEIGIQIDIPRQGSPQLMGITPMEIDRRGQYAGSWFSYPEARFELESRFWPQAVNTALWAAGELQLIGYFGPVGIDAMIYRHSHEGLQVRPLQDINARWTMGRLSLGWRRFVSSNVEGFWQHGNQDRFSRDPPLIPSKTIITSPEMIGDRCCRHFSRILIQEHPARGPSRPKHLD